MFCTNYTLHFTVQLIIFLSADINMTKVNDLIFHENGLSTVEGCNRRARKMYEERAKQLSLSEISTLNRKNSPHWYFINASILAYKKCQQEKKYNIQTKQKTKIKTSYMILFLENYNEHKTSYAFVDEVDWYGNMAHMHLGFWSGSQVFLLNPIFRGNYKATTVIDLKKPVWPTKRLPLTVARAAGPKADYIISDNLAAQVDNQIHGIKSVH